MNDRFPQVFQINASKGGVPKTPLPMAQVTAYGLVGDSQRDTEHHGGIDRALCLFSLDHIMTLQAEGHPIYPGSTGENITVSNLDWNGVVPGARFRLGDEVLIEITGFAAPCRVIQTSFSDHSFGRISQKSNPGWARAYARVLIPGTIRISDPIQQIN